jgi:hypothetical protein
MTTSAAEKQSNPYNVQVGQMWERCDRRDVGKRVRVESVGDTHAIVRSSGGPATKIRLDRFRPGSTGYRLVPA